MEIAKVLWYFYLEAMARSKKKLIVFLSKDKHIKQFTITIKHNVNKTINHSYSKK